MIYLVGGIFVVSGCRSATNIGEEIYLFVFKYSTMKDYTEADDEQIANVIKAFAEEECKGSSELYYKLTHRIAEDTDILRLAAHVRYGQPIPNSFLASVHFLLLANPNEELAKYYPSISGSEAEEIPYEIFRKFCFDNADKIKAIIAERIVQTNVISRCSYLAVIFSRLIAARPDKKVTTIDIGTSAGLTLNWDKYEYHYSNGLTIGKSPAKVTAEVRDSLLPESHLPNKNIRKIGIDQHIIDPTNAEEARWLRALIWPDQLERFAALNEALKIDSLKDIEFVQASAVIDFEKVISGISKDELLIVYCTHAMYQFPMEMREDFWKMLDKTGKGRDFFFLSAEGIKTQREKYQTNNTVVELTTYKDGLKTPTLMAEVNSHGRWFIWRNN